MARRTADLVCRAQEGDAEAFGDLVENYAGLVHGTIRAVVRQHEEVEDLVQETFLRAYESLSSLTKPSTFGPWLRRIAANATQDWLRRRRVRVRDDIVREVRSGVAAEPSPDIRVEAKESTDALWAAVDSLSPEHRRVLILYHVEGCRRDEIADFLGVSQARVKWWLGQARRRLRDEVERNLAERPLPRRDRQQTRERVAAALPLATLLVPRPPPRPSWAWRGGVAAAVAGLAGLTGLVGHRLAIIDEAEAPARVPAALRPLRAQVTLPPYSVSWAPVRPRPGESVLIRVHATPGAFEESAFVHVVADPAAPVDVVIPLERRGDDWEAAVDVPEAAVVLFLHVSGRHDEYLFERGGGRLASFHAETLSRFDRMLPVATAEAHILLAKADMAAGQGMDPGHVATLLEAYLHHRPQDHLQRLRRWNLLAASRGCASIAGEMVAFVERHRGDVDSQVWVTRATCHPVIDELYEEAWQSAPAARATAEIGYVAASRAAADSGRRLATFLQRHEDSPFADRAQRALLRHLVSTSPPDAARYADSLIASPDVRSREPSPWHARWVFGQHGGVTSRGLAFSTRFDLHVLAGESEQATHVAQGLLTSGVPDPWAYEYVARRLTTGRWLTPSGLPDHYLAHPGSAAAAGQDHRPDYPVDPGLAADLLVTGLRYTTDDHLLALPGLPVEPGLKAVTSSRRRAELLRYAAALRIGYLTNLGSLRLQAGDRRDGVALLRRAIALNDSLDRPERDAMPYAMLAEVLAAERPGEASRIARQGLRVVPGDPSLGHLLLDAAPSHRAAPLSIDARIRGLDGRPFSLADLRPRPVVLLYENALGVDVQLLAQADDLQRRFPMVSVVFVNGSSKWTRAEEASVQRQWGRSLRIGIDDGTLADRLALFEGALLVFDPEGRPLRLLDLHWARRQPGIVAEVVAAASSTVTSAR